MALPDDITRLVRPAPAENRLPAAATPKPIRAKTGLERSGSGGTTGGISSPLTETAIADRTYHVDAFTATTDGLFAWPAVKSVKMTDAAGREVLLQFASP
jgi:hypothetical protein